MKPTGMLRKVDELGRIVLPAEIRQAMDIKVKDTLEIYIDEKSIILEKYQMSCVFCTNSDHLVQFGEKLVCPDCLAKLKGLN